jgi:ferric-dicitrate binding protein FerR (iron transport regulator)
MGTSSSDKDALLALLEKYRAGQCTPEEAARIQAWFDSFEELPDTGEIKTAADEAVVNTMHTLFPRRGAFIRYIMLSAAAVLVVAITSLLFIYRFYMKAPVPVTYSYVTTKKGERKKLTLPDGSTLTMNAGSTLRIPSNFGDTARELVFTGQGTFDIQQDSKQPFVVYTGNVRTVVLGTAFDVKAYPGDKALQVAVLSGKVRIEKQEQGHTAILAPGVTKDQLLSYEAGSGRHELKHCNAAEIAGWQQNRLFFDQASLEEIAAVLERQYNTHITLAGKAKHNCRYTIQLKNEPLDKALLLIQQLSGISYIVNNNEIKINIASCE